MPLRVRFLAVGSVLTLLLSGMVAFAQPAAAAGPTVNMTGTAITYVGTTGADKVRIDTYSLGCTEGQLCIRIFSEPPITAAPGCVLTASGIARCGPATPATVSVALNGGDDEYTTSTTYMTPTNFVRISVNGGLGNDTLRGGGASEVFWGAPGDDVILPDNGVGDQHAARDIISGGEGFDTLDYSTSPGADRGIKVSLDDVANDGSSIPGDVDNLYANVEAFGLGAGNDVFIGSDLPETVRGGAGNDTIDGAGGPDTIGGGAGNDTLTGGAGIDQVYGDDPTDLGATGDDLLLVRDNEADRANCGPGNDRAQADSADQIDECEAIEINNPPVASATLTIVARRLNANRNRKRAVIGVACTGGLECEGRVVIRSTAKSRRLVGSKRLGASTYSIAANTRGPARVTLNRTARKLLKRTKRAAVQITFTASTGERGTRKVRLTR